MKYIRRIAGYTWTGHNTNAQIPKELKITPILDELLEHRRSWIHVNRMPRNRLPRVEGIMLDLWRDFWIRETRRGQQVAQLHDRYMIMMMMIMMVMTPSEMCFVICNGCKKVTFLKKLRAEYNWGSVLLFSSESSVCCLKTRWLKYIKPFYWTFCIIVRFFNSIVWKSEAEVYEPMVLRRIAGLRREEIVGEKLEELAWLWAS